MRAIKLIAIHCSATEPDQDIGAKEIRQWHIDGGWDDIGYHYVIRRSGVLEFGRPEEQVGSHIRGYNTNSLGVCLVGGRYEVDYTVNQWACLESLVSDLTGRYPEAKVKGHRDYDSSKDCPWFNVEAWWG